MDNNNNNDLRPMTPFDNLVSSKPLRMIKLLIPYTPPAKQRTLAVYVKFLELQNTMSFFKDFGNDLSCCELDEVINSPLEILSEMQPFMDEEEGTALQSMISMMSMMDMIKSYQDMASTNNASDSDNNFNPMELMKGFLSPEQQNMFDTYNMMFSNNMNIDFEGEMNEE